MNKTVTINISGIIFHIEEDAYSKLQNYLTKVRDRFSAEDGREEIMSDIESRIAEILNERVGPTKQVVLMSDIDHVIALMGEPEMIADSASETKQEENKQEASDRKYRRRLYRDTDDKVLGGVCSGISYYFDIDPVWIRLGFAIAFFVFGTGLLFYILLMIIIPKAVTTAEKLEMRGEPVDLNNISRSIKEDFEGFKKKVKDFGEDTKRRGKEWKNETRDWSRRNRVRGGFEDFFHGVFRVFGRLIAFLLIFFGILFLIGLLTSSFSISHFGPKKIGETFSSFFSDGFHSGLAIFAILLTFGIPILMMIYKGIRMMFRIQRPDRVVGITALSLWFLGLALMIYSGINAANSFSEETTLHESLPLQTKGMDTLYLSVNIDKEMENMDYHSSWNKEHHYARRYTVISIDGENMKFGYPNLNIVPSTNDSFELVVFKHSRGRDQRDAFTNAKGISFPIRINGNKIIFPNYFSLEKNSHWRSPEVTVELRVPKGKVLFLNSTMVDILQNAENTSNTIRHDMVDRRWKMTSYGLECIDCAGLDNKGAHQEPMTTPPPVIIHDTITIIKTK